MSAPPKVLVDRATAESAAMLLRNHPNSTNANVALAARWITDAITDHDASGLVEEIRAALEGDSNDAEHDALVQVAEAFNIEYDDEWAATIESRILQELDN